MICFRFSDALAALAEQLRAPAPAPRRTNRPRGPIASDTARRPGGRDPGHRAAPEFEDEDEDEVAVGWDEDRPARIQLACCAKNQESGIVIFVGVMRCQSVQAILVGWIMMGWDAGGGHGRRRRSLGAQAVDVPSRVATSQHHRIPRRPPSAACWIPATVIHFHH